MINEYNIMIMVVIILMVLLVQIYDEVTKEGNDE